MLKNLFISKVRIRILELYMSNIKASYHVRGLVREIGEEINAVRRELLNLKDAGILKSTKEGNRIVYMIDKKCPIIGELRSMFFKESEVGKILRTKLSAVEGITVAIVTEAFLKNKHDNPLDIDMLFIGTMKIKDLTSTMNALEKEIDRSMKYAAMKLEDFEFGRRKRDPILMNVLENENVMILGKDSDLI
ncbi:MAG: winged helix-turn-helix domain-containing protein [Candidatus Dojkabacteria bacterium]